MSTEVTCTYFATAPTAQSLSGTIKLTGCDPSIGTISAIDVIAIVLVIVLVGLAIQWFMGHLDRKALKAVREDLRHVVRVHPNAEAAAEATAPKKGLHPGKA